MSTISREDAIEAICTQGTKEERDKRYVISIATAKQRAVDILESLPSVEKVGKWIIHETQNDRYDDMICPFCRKSYTVDAYRIDDIGFTAEDFNFCPNCGARMEGEEG